MNKYPVSYVQIHICELLEELPFQITRYGKVIATVNRFNIDNVTVKVPENKTNSCPHGFMLGLCKKGCK